MTYRESNLHIWMNTDGITESVNKMRHFILTGIYSEQMFCKT